MPWKVSDYRSPHLLLHRSNQKWKTLWKQKTVASTRIENQSVAVSGDEGVYRSRCKDQENIALQEHHDALENASKLFNNFAVTIVVSIAEIEGSEGDHSIVLYILKM